MANTGGWRDFLQLHPPHPGRPPYLGSTVGGAGVLADPYQGPGSASVAHGVEISGIRGRGGPVKLNPVDCNIDFDIEPDGISGSGLSSGGFGYCWSGARATLGLLVSSGAPLGPAPVRYCFGCVITETQPVEMPDTPANLSYLCRVGISRGDTDVGALGEGAGPPTSFGYGGTGKASAGGSFTNYGEPFGVGDTIVCTVEILPPPQASQRGPGPPPHVPLDQSAPSQPQILIGFTKNGRHLGLAFNRPLHLPPTPGSGSGEAAPPGDAAYFPHVLLKNVKVRMQFGPASGLVPPGGFLPWEALALLPEWGPAVGLWAAPPPRPDECEVLMMVGLPGSGKTTFAEAQKRKHPSKRYIVLGTNLAIDQMKVPGLTRKRSYAQRFENLMPRATEIFNTLLERACRVPHNYILDQTNVYFSARRRKLRPFAAFRKVAVVVVCSPEELRRRSALRAEEMGKEVPEDAVNEMKVNFALPDVPPPGRQSKEGFDEVRYVELSQVEAMHVIDAEKTAAKVALKAGPRPANKLAPGSGPGFVPGSGSGSGPRPGVGPGSGPGSGSGSGPRPRVGPGTGPGAGPGPGFGPGSGSGSGPRPGVGPGSGPGPGSGSGSGSGPGVGPGSGPRFGSGPAGNIPIGPLAVDADLVAPPAKRGPGVPGWAPRDTYTSVPRPSPPAQLRHVGAPGIIPPVAQHQQLAATAPLLPQPSAHHPPHSHPLPLTDPYRALPPPAGGSYPPQSDRANYAMLPLGRSYPPPSDSYNPSLEGTYHTSSHPPNPYPPPLDRTAHAVGPPPHAFAAPPQDGNHHTLLHSPQSYPALPEASEYQYQGAHSPAFSCGGVGAGGGQAGWRAHSDAFGQGAYGNTGYEAPQDHYPPAGMWGYGT